MCGIVGIVDKRAAPDPRALEIAAASLRKRGPDDLGVWTGGMAGLAHRRLAIIDLTAAGHQPMLSADGRYVIVLNGEIYNFQELKRELGGGLGPWQSNSDTEVILAAYARWGARCLERFHGMFAFAIWDTREHRLFAARDRMGVKPFYYHHSEERFAFASRPRALFSLQPSLSAEYCEQALRLYLESGYVPAPYSIHTTIRKLPQAHYLILDARGLRIERYWDFRHIAPEPAWTVRQENDLLDDLDALVTQSVKLRMVSDAPYGAFLSGGIDSPLVVAIMRKLTPRAVSTFTIGFAEKDYDESAYAEAVANHLQTEHRCEQLRMDDLLELIPTFFEEFDEPFFDSSAFPTMAVSRLARRHVTVSLSGDGGDELFGGYHYYQIARSLRPLFALPPALRNGLSAAVGAIPAHRARLLAGALRQGDAIGAFAFTRSIAKDFDAVLLPEVLQRTGSLQELFANTARAFPPGLETAEIGMRLDACHTLPDDYLQKVDLGSMAFSLESRDPLLDQDLVEWAMRLPLKWKLRGRQNKYLLRRLAYRYLPPVLLNRPKQGFGVPLGAWLRGPLKQWALDHIEDAASYQRVPLNRRKVRSLFDLHVSGARDSHPLLWAVLVLLGFAARRQVAS